MTHSALRLALVAAGSLAVMTASPAVAQQADQTTIESGLSAKALASGNSAQAIASLEKKREAAPHDPALLINLGIAYAHRGDDAKARALFEAAKASPNPVELATADGKTTDSRRLARKALAMLARGEFNNADQITRR